MPRRNIAIRREPRPSGTIAAREISDLIPDAVIRRYAAASCRVSQALGAPSLGSGRQRSSGVMLKPLAHRAADFHVQNAD